MEVRIDKAIDVPCDARSFYRKWLSFLTPIHHFTPQVTQIAGELLRHRQRLSKVIKDDDILMRELLGQPTRDEILKDCDVTLSTYRVTLNKLKKAGFFIDGKINPLLIPKVPEDGDFKMLLMFNIKDEAG